ncbi:HNH endonuclease [Georgenia sp. M64]|uniref:HNH endonuclease n=1 Tax=Georgenia sp. M64 TaxID=3120520 RepID=UPI0030E01426
MSESVIERELAARLAAIDWLTRQRAAGVEYWTHADLSLFTFDGTRIPLMDRQRGIRKPAGFDAALAIRTVFRPEGAMRPYEDGMGADGLLRYKWRGSDPNHPENRALRKAMERQVPIIWFEGFAPALYTAIAPVYLLAEEPERQQFVVALGEDQLVLDVGGEVNPRRKRYVETMTKRRLHQPLFRAGVMHAYETRCAICAFRHGNLLDAAHITPDSTEDGVPATSNGLALCKIHHGAYDANIMGIRPDLVIEVRPDILEEIDGPMLKHGIQALHGEKLMMVPRSRRERPDEVRLEARYQQFRTAPV